MALVASDIDTLEDLEADLVKWHADYSSKITTMKASYKKTMEEFRVAQESLIKKHTMDQKIISSYEKCLKRLTRSSKNSCEKERIQKIKERLNTINAFHSDIACGLPSRPSWFLRQCIGDVNVSLYWKKLDYKKNYESFKLKMAIIGLVLVLVNWLLITIRFMDCIFFAFLLWYFSSITLQEQILFANGSKIRFWWRIHHYLSTLCCGVMMIWPDGESYKMFRTQIYVYSIFQAIIHIQQYIYQNGILYRLRALGLTSDMSISTDGGHPIIWNKFSILLLVLLCAYIFQFYNAYTLFNMYMYEGHDHWHPLLAGILFVIFFIGNSYTLLDVLIQKRWWWSNRMLTDNH